MRWLLAFLLLPIAAQAQERQPWQSDVTADPTPTTNYNHGYNHGYSPDYNKGQYGTGTGVQSGYSLQPPINGLGPPTPAAPSLLKPQSPWQH